MKYMKYFAGSIIISLGLLSILAILLRALQFEVPSEVARYLLAIWIGTAVVSYPIAMKIMRV